MIHLVRGLVKTLFWTDSRNTNLDAYGRLRISDPFPIFDCQTQYDKQSFLMDDILVGGGTTTFLPNESSVQLNVGTASGDKVTRRSRQWIRYQPSKSQQITMTGVLGSPKSNVSQRIGYFEDSNGIFFEQTIAGISVVRRTFASGAIVNNVVLQANWNLDTLDGSNNAGNPSGKLLDTTKDLIYIIDFQWLGVSRIRWGINFGDTFVYVHQFTASNVLSSVYMTTGNLPVTYEIENTAVSSSSTSMKAICCAVNSEGGTDHGGFIFSNFNPSDIATPSRRPIFSIRPKLTFNSIINRGQIVPLKYTAFNLGGSGIVLRYELIYNGVLSVAYTFTVTAANALAGATYTNNGQTFTVLNTIVGSTTLVCSGTGAPSASGTLTKATGSGDATIAFSSVATGAAPNFVSQSVNSIVEYDTTASAITGGEIIDSGFLYVNEISQNFIQLKYPITLNALGTVADVITLVIGFISGTPASAYARGGITWKELR